MTANVISNLVSYVLVAAAKEACDGAVDTLMTYLKPTLLNLTDDQRAALPRIGAKHDVLIVKGAGYARTNPELLPAFLDAGEYQRDVDAITILTPYRQKLGQIVDMIDDTMDQARAEGYAAGRALYNNSKTAADMGVPGAASVRDDLAVCFAGQGRRTTVTAPAPVPGPAPTPAPSPAPSDPPAVDD